MVQPGVTTVEFLERGTSLTDVMGEATGVSKAVAAVARVPAAGVSGAASMLLMSSTRPVPRPASLVVIPSPATSADPLTAAVGAATADAPGVTVTAPAAAANPAQH